jgi:hypothetical protein
LLIDQVTVDEENRGVRDLMVAWVDYVKAYDRVPHEWLVKVLSIVGVIHLGGLSVPDP